MYDVLKILADNAVWLGVFSNKPDELSCELIAHYFPDISFGIVRGAKSGYPLKPNPEVLLDILEKEKIEKDNAFYIGDSDVDMLTARNARLAGVGAAWGFRGAEELRNAGARFIAYAPMQVAELLAGFFK